MTLSIWIVYVLAETPPVAWVTQAWRQSPGKSGWNTRKSGKPVECAGFRTPLRLNAIVSGTKADCRPGGSPGSRRSASRSKPNSRFWPGQALHPVKTAPRRPRWCP